MRNKKGSERKVMGKKKRIFCTVIFYGADILLSTIVFVALFHTPLLKQIGVFFYRGCFLLLAAGAVSVMISGIGKRMFRKLALDGKDSACIFFIFTGITLGWFILIPVTVERSISVYMLSYMDENDRQEITAGQFGDIFYEQYIMDYGAFDKRFEEQIVSGNIKETANGGYVITDSGRRIVSLFRLCAGLFDTERWLVYPKSNEIIK